jgi:hypothetical protein
MGIDFLQKFVVVFLNLHAEKHPGKKTGGGREKVGVGFFFDFFRFFCRAVFDVYRQVSCVI